MYESTCEKMTATSFISSIYLKSSPITLFIFVNKLLKKVGVLMENHEIEIEEFVISLLDIITILMVEDNPALGIVLLILLKMVTKDKLIRISLILLIIVLDATLPKD